MADIEPTYSQHTIIAALRQHYPRAAFVEELQIEDTYVTGIRRATYGQQYRAYFEERGRAVADEVPDDFDFASEKPIRRIDALMLNKRQWTALEVKISRADFFRETDAKRRPWRAHTHRFVYVTPPGLLEVHEVPAGCGLWEVNLNTGQLTILKKAQINKTPTPFPFDLVQVLFYRLSNYESSRPRSRRRRRRT